MSNIIIFKTEDDFEIFKKPKTIKLIGSGNEGECFEFDDSAYKFITNEYRIYALGITPKDIVTTQDISLSSFAFPEELYVVRAEDRDKIRGYKTKLIRNNIFSDNKNKNRLRDNKGLLDLERLSMAYKIMLEDIHQLNERHIAILDLPSNLLFDGKKLTAIDTLGYEKTSTDVRKNNYLALNNSIEKQVKLFISDNYLYDQIPRLVDNNIDAYLEEANKIMKI